MHPFVTDVRIVSLLHVNSGVMLRAEVLQIDHSMVVAIELRDVLVVA